MFRWRPGVWSQVLENFLNSFGKTARTVVGKDKFGNLYYEEAKRQRGGVKMVHRGYVPGSGEEWQKIPVEWEAWLRQRRKLPPSEEEIIRNEKVSELRLKRIVDGLGKGTSATAATNFDKSLADMSTEETVGKKAKYPKIDTKSVDTGTGPSSEYRPYPKYDEYEDIPGAAKQEEFRTDKK